MSPATDGQHALAVRLLRAPCRTTAPPCPRIPPAKVQVVHSFSTQSGDAPACVVPHPLQGAALRLFCMTAHITSGRMMLCSLDLRTPTSQFGPHSIRRRFGIMFGPGMTSTARVVRHPSVHIGTAPIFIPQHLARTGLRPSHAYSPTMPVGGCFLGCAADAEVLARL